MRRFRYYSTLSPASVRMAHRTRDTTLSRLQIAADSVATKASTGRRKHAVYERLFRVQEAIAALLSLTAKAVRASAACNNVLRVFHVLHLITLDLMRTKGNWAGRSKNEIFGSFLVRCLGYGLGEFPGSKLFVKGQRVLRNTRPAAFLCFGISICSDKG
jgi:hypothetical protein